jgi:hypothetical protein
LVYRYFNENIKLFNLELNTNKKSLKKNFHATDHFKELESFKKTAGLGDEKIKANE